METNLTAAFKKKDDLDSAAKALKRQGVLDLRIHQPKSRPEISKAAQHQPVGNEDAIELIEAGEEYLYSLDVFVEKSRWRQAEDIIIRHGGQF
jgi:uncharacterized membrane protein YkoI